MTDESPAIARARALLHASGSVADALSQLTDSGITRTIPRIQALRELAPIGLSMAAQIVEAHRNGEPHVARLDQARLVLLAHRGVREAWAGAGQHIYHFFHAAVLAGHRAWTLVPTGQTSHGHSFHFWWREDIGGDEHDPLFGLITGSHATIGDFGEALRRAVACDPVLARHVEVLRVTDDRVSCRFHLDAADDAPPA